MRNSVAEYRKERELNQGELANVVGVTRQTINAVERNRYNPSLELALKLAAFFDCEVKALFHPNFDEEDL